MLDTAISSPAKSTHIMIAKAYNKNETSRVLVKKYLHNE